MTRNHILCTQQISGMPMQFATQIAEKLLERRNEFFQRNQRCRFVVSELQLSEEDCQWLFRWVSKLPSSWINQILGSTNGGGTSMVHGDDWAGVDVVGFVLLVAFAEYARREVNEDDSSIAFWHCIAQMFDGDAAELLFAGHQPIQDLKDALKRAAQYEHVALQHRFDDANTQNWYATIMAQIGITRSYIPRLRAALSGQNRGRAVEYLLGISKGEQSFSDFWETCRRLREGDSSIEDARANLRQNPFVLEDWVEEIVESLSVLPRSRGHTSKHVRVSNNLVQQVYLKWDGHNLPQFMLEVDAPGFDLSGDEDAAEIFIGASSKPVARLLRLPDSDRFDRHLPIPLPVSALIGPTIQLRICSGDANLEEQVELWDPNEIVTLYDLSSQQRVIVEDLPHSHPLAVIVKSDCQLEGHTKPHLLGSYRMYFVSSLASQPFDIFDAEGTLIYSASAQCVDRDLQIELQVTTAEQKKEVRLGTDFQINIKLEDDSLILHKLRIFGERYSVQQTNGGWISAPVAADGRIKTSEVTVYLLLENSGERFWHKQRMYVPFVGCLISSSAGWQVLPRNACICTRDLHGKQLKIFRNSGATTDLFDGARMLGRATERPQQISDLDGLGESLVVVSLDEDFQPQTICESVVWRGLIRSVAFEEDGELGAVTLSRQHELSECRILAWRLGSPLCWNIEREQTADDRFSILVPGEVAHPDIIAIEFRGECTGVWWREGIQLPDEMSDEELHHTAKLLHWMRLPILLPAFRRLTMKLLCSSSSNLLADWISITDTCFYESLGLTLKLSVKHVVAWRRALCALVTSEKEQTLKSLKSHATYWTQEKHFRELFDLSPLAALNFVEGTGSRRLMALTKIHDRDALIQIQRDAKLPYPADVVIGIIEDFLKRPGDARHRYLEEWVDQSSALQEWIFKNFLDYNHIQDHFLRFEQRSTYSWHN